MSIRDIKKEIAYIKKALKPYAKIGIVVTYNGEIHNNEGYILPKSVIAIDGRDVSRLSEDKIQAIIEKAEVIFYLPDNGRDPGIWEPYR